ncbi:hypothetical protein [Streptomyces sp. RKAG337]|uniref:hypothetical protein n=1 Tax=Streptomyces sp. RKAG337 TaxID=2893404 RepID=UPI002033309F|nr:hypothetical protein [Streptomyces sp. RKAG337]MCM2430984.1 hypothetical protein [Streptomyces sp. RKAG337]
MPLPLTWDQHQSLIAHPDWTDQSGAVRHRWEVRDQGRIFTVDGSHAHPDYPMYSLYETTDGAPATPATRLSQFHSLLRARMFIAKLAHPGYARDWTTWETALIIGEGIDLATAPVAEYGSWSFTFDFALDPEREGFEYEATGPLLKAAFSAAGSFFEDNEVTDPDACEEGILSIVLASYARR